MKLYDFGIVIFLALVIGLCGLGMTKHSTGFEEAIYVPNDLPDVQLYYSIEGVEDKIWWDMDTVQDRSMRLAELHGYQGADIACSADGNFLYILGD